MTKLKGLVLAFIMSLFLSSCQSYQDHDVLDDLGQQVIKSKQGIEIEIKPSANMVKREKFFCNVSNQGYHDL